MKRFLIAPDKFKGSLTAVEAARAIGEGVRALDESSELDVCPIADGGEGFMEAVHRAVGGQWMTCPAVDALGRDIESRYLLTGRGSERTAVMEMSETAGMWRLSAEERNPMRASTRGVGLQMRHAIEQARAGRLVMGLGGSATNDGGCGMAAALGVEFQDASGELIDPLPERLQQLRRIEMGQRMVVPRITVACDVENPLLGERGATAVFSAQKGSTAASRPMLEAALRQVVEVSRGADHALLPGAGAAGGLGFGLLHFADAELESGFDLLAGLLDLESRVIAADLVITGEGSLDAQSLAGKGPVALARLARRHDTPVVACCGQVDDTVRQSGEFDAILALEDSGLPLEDLIPKAAPLLRRAVETGLRGLHP